MQRYYENLEGLVTKLSSVENNELLNTDGETLKYPRGCFEVSNVRNAHTHGGVRQNFGR